MNTEVAKPANVWGRRPNLLKAFAAWVIVTKDITRRNVIGLLDDIVDGAGIVSAEP
jgi:hypothetical protein